MCVRSPIGTTHSIRDPCARVLLAEYVKRLNLPRHRRRLDQLEIQQPDGRPQSSAQTSSPRCFEGQLSINAPCSMLFPARSLSDAEASFAAAAATSAVVVCKYTNHSMSQRQFIAIYKRLPSTTERRGGTKTNWILKCIFCFKMRHVSHVVVFTAAEEVVCSARLVALLLCYPTYRYSATAE